MNHRPPLERMMIIAGKLRRGERFNARTLAEELEVSEKTVQRDIDFMRDRLRYEIAWQNHDLDSDGTYVGQPPKERVL